MTQLIVPGMKIVIKRRKWQSDTNLPISRSASIPRNKDNGRNINPHNNEAAIATTTLFVIFMAFNDNIFHLPTMIMQPA